MITPLSDKWIEGLDGSICFKEKDVKEFVAEYNQIIHLFIIGEIDEFEMYRRRDELVGDL